jgi:beta-glucosidase-like glycosyl hydrolase/CubicO group peptidase (beta-lactamase class C family)
MIKTVAPLLFALTLASCASSVPAPRAAVIPGDSAGWVNATLASLTLEEKVGQLIMGRLQGDFENIKGPELQRITRLIRNYYIGGFAVGIGSPAEVAIKLNALQGAAKIPLLIAADLEWGSGMRLWRPTYLPYGMEGGGGTAFPFNMGVGATGDPAWADTIGRITGLEARAVGIHWVFAPVLDVNTHPANPIVNVRAYGSDPHNVARFGAAFVNGAKRARVLTAAKHFPGHGDTHLDSHVELPVLDVSRQRLDSVELVPFRAAVQAGIPGIMLGHLAIPSVIGDRATPSSISAAIGEEVLRKQLGFNGLIVTDALTMGALRNVPGYTPGEIAVRAFEAGSDVILSPPDVAQAHTALVAAVHSGRVTQARLDAAVHRILAAKAWLGLHRDRNVDVAKINEVVAAPEYEDAAAVVAARSITLVRDDGNRIPLDPRWNRRVAVIAFSAPTDLGAGRALSAELRSIYGRGVTFMRLDENVNNTAFENAIQQAGNADAIVFATFLMPISGQGHIQVPQRANEAATRLAQLNKPTVVVAFGDPYGPATLPGSTTYMLAWQPRGEHAQRAAARAIAGAAPITGVLPIDLPGTMKGTGLRRVVVSGDLRPARPSEVGMDDSILGRIDSIMNAAIANGAAPGGAIAVGRHGRLIKLQGYGKLDLRPSFGLVTDSSIYDLASLTKVVATTTATMMLIEDGRLQLDAPLSRYLPELLRYPDKQNITVRNVLMHNAGFRAFAPLWRNARGREQYLRAIIEIPLEYQTGTGTIYSDFGPILLGLAIERVTGMSLDEYVRRNLFAPLGMRETLYNPLAQAVALAGSSVQGSDESSPLFSRIAPTEVDTLFRRQHMHGRVHDENAFAIGGVAGHAGLFSSARDLAKFAQMLLNGGYFDGRRVLSAETINMFTRRQSNVSSRAIGWDTPARNSSAGDYFSESAFGHTGFTGTSMWMDPARNVFVVLLTNRVNPTRENQRHVALRRAISDAVNLSITDVPVVKREWQ